MAELTTLARPYARAAFEYANANKALDDWSAALALLAELAEQDDAKSVLDSPKLTSAQKAGVVLDVCGDKVDGKVKQFVSVLAENKRLDLLASIQVLFENLKSQQQKFADVQVASAYPLEASTEKALADKLSATLNSDVSITTQVDESLLGGVVVRAGDTVIDSSVRGRLGKLAENLGV